MAGAYLLMNTEQWLICSNNVRCFSLINSPFLSDLPIAYYAYMLYNMHPKENPRKID
ncbi:hypothetical protein HKBW3S03_01373 [Candidatus Hakubella thermalkaliphila]|uniref:Uncharacterized protein n=1 Tax=Candidatus Hakubella thermalkaliphila TaxID=2754717 RepID=A0A6V8PD17_9ACTN|nr:hypothetical protein HKBW3S03_01373 [Candidatus Hakubella thermalkaliphila]GFP30223.1 hypothetical protein HKBW3S34_01144 [Candidatus Hakubella thermalkaliphila]GFP39853.1 hypothetical protein HKBW3S47_01550 [Candidatus Hakubella thermalkaliphila]GFP41690.1 hypothetical protein HKBW3C_00816 [Candidatus Hakubella thermalkaliphila]